MNQNKSTRVLIIVMSALVFIAIGVAKFYYYKQNYSIDPRIKQARVLYERYNYFAQLGDVDSIFWLLDTIESIYSKHEHYKNSFEVGVLYNNRAALYLTLALQTETNQEFSTLGDSLFNLAENSSKKSIFLYKDWLKKYQDSAEETIANSLENDFLFGLEDIEPTIKSKIFNKRKEEIKESLIETKRRLSVSYTNLGVVCRYKKEYEMAAQYYKKAIDLWDKNLTAENNLNILLGRPIKKRNMIQKLFPSERI